MAISKITSKYQTTVPKEVRDRLKISFEDSLEWTIRDHKAVVRPARSRLFRWMGYLKVGPGSTVEDIKKARSLRGRIR